MHKEINQAALEQLLANAKRATTVLHENSMSWPRDMKIHRDLEALALKLQTSIWVLEQALKKPMRAGPIQDQIEHACHKKIDVYA